MIVIAVGVVEIESVVVIVAAIVVIATKFVVAEIEIEVIYLVLII